MKKIFTLLFILYSITSNSQTACTPNPQYVLPGMYPDSTIGLADGFVGQVYNEVITVIVALDTTVIVLGSPISVTIIDIELTSVTGLPANFSYSCDPTNCSFPGGSAGCILINVEK